MPDRLMPRLPANCAGWPISIFIRSGRTIQLQPALVHEEYLRLVDQHHARW